MSDLRKYYSRRINPSLFFEPIYDPSLKSKLSSKDFSSGDWDFSQQKGPCRFIFNGTDRQERGEYEKIEEIIFLECDFLDVQGKAITFKKCKFDLCDFRGEFKNVKFSQCIFVSTSLSLAKFYNCQFRDCLFEKIGVSGNETQFILSDITNPGDFLRAASTNVCYLPKGTTEDYQLLRLAKTRATLARVIMSNQSTEGSDISYYDAVKASTLYGALSRAIDANLNLPKFDNQESRERRPRLFEAWLKISFPFVQFSTGCEYWILQAAGVVNAWGRSIFRVLMVGIFLAVIAGLMRSFFLCKTFSHGVIEAIEVFLLFGYTKHSLPQDVLSTNILNLGTAFMGLCWFAVAAATIVNRVTRVRG